MDPETDSRGAYKLERSYKGNEWDFIFTLHQWVCSFLLCRANMCQHNNKVIIKLLNKGHMLLFLSLIAGSLFIQIFFQFSRQKLVTVRRKSIKKSVKCNNKTLWFKLKCDKFPEAEVAAWRGNEEQHRVHRAVWRVAESTFHTWTQNSSNVSVGQIQCKRLCVSQRRMLPGDTKVMAKHDWEVTHRSMCSQVTIEVQKHAL